MRGMSFGPSLQLVASALGLPFDHVEVHGAQGTRTQGRAHCSRVVPAGTVAATRTIVSGMREWKAPDELHDDLVRVE